MPYNTSSLWLKSLIKQIRGKGKTIRKQKAALSRPQLERLEDRLAPANHSWTGLGGDLLWSDPKNWDIGAPAYGESDTILNFPGTPGASFSLDDMAGLQILSIGLN